MIKYVLQKLFSSNIKQREIQTSAYYEYKLKKGEVQSVYTPELENQKNLVLTKWYFKPGEIIKPGEIVGDISNENIIMEFESMFKGKIIYTCPLNTKLIKGTKIFKVERI